MTTFMTKVRITEKKQMRINMPKAFIGTRWDVIVSGGYVVVSKSETGNLVSAAAAGQIGQLTFRKKALEDLPKTYINTRHKFEVTVKDGCFSFVLQPAQIQTPTIKPRAPTFWNNNASILGHIRELQNYAQTEGFEIRVKENKISLVKTQILEVA